MRPPDHGRTDAALVRLLHEERAGPLHAFCVRFIGPAACRGHRAGGVPARLAQPVEHRPAYPAGPLWLLHVARNLLTDAHRAEQSRTLLVTGDSPSTPPRPRTTWTGPSRHGVVAGVARLTPQLREILVHAHWLGRGVIESADALGSHPGSRCRGAWCDCVRSDRPVPAGHRDHGRRRRSVVRGVAAGRDQFIMRRSSCR